MKKSERAKIRPMVPAVSAPALAWFPAVLASAWGALAISLSLLVWPLFWNSLGLMWTALIMAPDFSWTGFFRAMGGHIAGLATLAVLMSASFGAGWPLARFLGIATGPSRPFLQMALGWGAISFINQGLGYPGLYFSGIFGVETALLAMLGLSALWREKTWRQFSGADWKSEWPRLLALGIVLAGAHLLSRMPNTDEDARLYHLAGPESYLFIHKIHPEPGHFAWHMPFGAEMDFIVPYALGGFTLAKQVNVAFLAVLLGLVWRLSASLGRGSLWAPVWMGTAGLALGQCWEGKNDIAMAMYCTGGALCAVEGMKGSRRWLVPAAWLAGLAMGVKFTSGLFVAGLLAGLFRLLSPRLHARNWAFLAGLGLLPFAGWLAASGLFLGNPFHPFLSGIFPDLGWGPFYSGWLDRQARSISPAEALMKRDWLLGMWRGIGAHDHGSVALFGLLPLALLGRKSREARLLVVTMIVAYLAWLPSHRNARYLFPLIPLVSALASDAGGAAGIFSGWSARWRSILGTYSIAVALLAVVWPLSPSGYLFLAGQSSREEVFKAGFTTWETMRNWVNMAVPARGRLLLSGEERRLWFNCRTVSNGPIFEPPFWKWTKESRTPDEVRKRVKQAGFTHLVHNFVSGQYRRLRWYPGPDWDNRQLGLFSEFASRYLVHAWRSPRVDNTNGGFHAFTFSPVRLARPSPKYFLPSTEGIFFKARQALESGRMNDAIKESADTQARVPGVREAEYLRAAMVYGTNDLLLVWRLLEPGLREGFVTSHNIDYAARAAINLGRVDDAIRLFCLEARMSPGSGGDDGLSFSLLARAQARMARRDFRGAWHDAEAAGNLLPWDARSRWAAANALMAMGRYPEASRFLAEGKRLAGVGEVPAAPRVGSGTPPRSMMGK